MIFVNYPKVMFGQFKREASFYFQAWDNQY